MAKKKPISKKGAKSALKDKQIQFCLEYLVDFNATQAAIRAGYSQKTAGRLGYNLLKHTGIRKHIDSLLEERSLGKHETIKLLSDIAQGSLNDYFATTTRIVTPKIKKPLKSLISDLEAKIEDQHKLIIRAKITKADALAAFNEQENMWHLQILQYQIELERNPRAFRLVDGESRLEETVELDLAKLVKDKERGKIKSVTPNEHGLKIEMYAADAALRDIARYHGLFEKDNEQAKPILNIETQQIVFK